MATNYVYLGDCNYWIPLFYPNKSFHLANVDPPYFKGVGKLGFYGKRVSATGVKRSNYPIPDWDNNLPDEKYFSMLQRLSVNQIIWGANYYPFIGETHPTPRRENIDAWLDKHPKGWIVWDKLNGNNSFSDFELAWTSFDRPTVIFKFLWNGMQQGKSLAEPTVQQGNKRLNEKRIHPTQKPVLLYRWTLQNYARPGDKILDTHVGSGSHRIACHDAGFAFVGCELDPLNHKRQERRYLQHRQQMLLNFEA